MGITNQSNVGWLVANGSGWNRHKTADTLRRMGGELLPPVPLGYGVLVAPISDKPLGLRCALVRALPRRMEPSISIHTPGGNYVQRPASIQYDHIRLADIPDMAAAVDLLAANGYLPTQSRPEGWPDGSNWFRHADGTWASIEMLDDGPDGDANGWARDQFDMDVEIIHSVKCDQQSDDDSEYFIKVMDAQIANLTPQS